jgi:hypothetical protein
MGSDAANIAASVAKSLEVDRSPHASQRASEITQDQLADQATAALHRKAPDAASQVRKEKIRQDRERRRREMERRMSHPESSPDESDTEGGLDVVA